MKEIKTERLLLRAFKEEEKILYTSVKRSLISVRKVRFTV